MNYKVLRPILISILLLILLMIIVNVYQLIVLVSVVPEDYKSIFIFSGITSLLISAFFYFISCSLIAIYLPKFIETKIDENYIASILYFFSFQILYELIKSLLIYFQLSEEVNSISFENLEQDLNKTDYTKYIFYFKFIAIIFGTISF